MLSCIRGSFTVRAALLGLLLLLLLLSLFARPSREDRYGRRKVDCALHLGIYIHFMLGWMVRLVTQAVVVVVVVLAPIYI